MNIFKEFRSNYNYSQKEIAEKLGIDQTTVNSYEMGRNYPTLKILLKIIKLFPISLDYLFLGEKCLYPKNLELLNLALQFDSMKFSSRRGYIEETISTLLNKKIDETIEIRQDNITIPLTDNFYQNLKIIRNNVKLTQPQLAERIGISRSLLSQYELKSYPSFDKLKKLSEVLNISIHALTTGKPLFFHFTDGHFGKTMLLADKLLSLEDQKVLIHLMTRILEDV